MRNFIIGRWKDDLIKTHAKKMENRVLRTKYRITSPLNDLTFIRDLSKISDKLEIYDDFELEPFATFSLEFQAEYWYLKYVLLRDKQILITDEFKVFFTENNLNIICLKLTDRKSFVCEFIDGTGFVSFISENIQTRLYFETLALVEI